MNIVCVYYCRREKKEAFCSGSWNNWSPLKKKKSLKVTSHTLNNTNLSYPDHFFALKLIKFASFCIFISCSASCSFKISWFNSFLFVLWWIVLGFVLFLGVVSNFGFICVGLVISRVFLVGGFWICPKLLSWFVS